MKGPLISAGRGVSVWPDKTWNSWPPAPELVYPPQSLSWVQKTANRGLSNDDLDLEASRAAVPRPDRLSATRRRVDCRARSLARCHCESGLLREGLLEHG